MQNLPFLGIEVSALDGVDFATATLSSLKSYIVVTAPLGLNISLVSGINSRKEDLVLLCFSSRYSTNRGMAPSFPPGTSTCSPSHIANFFSVISGVEKVRE